MQRVQQITMASQRTAMTAHLRHSNLERLYSAHSYQTEASLRSAQFTKSGWMWRDTKHPGYSLWRLPALFLSLQLLVFLLLYWLVSTATKYLVLQGCAQEIAQEFARGEGIVCSVSGTALNVRRLVRIIFFLGLFLLLLLLLLFRICQASGACIYACVTQICFNSIVYVNQ